MKRAIIRSVLCTLLSLSMILSDAGIVFAKSDFVFDASDNVVIEELADEEVLKKELLDVNLSEKEVADKETEDVEADLLSEETSEEETVVEDTVTVSENDIEIPIEESIEITVNEADILMASDGETHNFAKNNGKLTEGKWGGIEGCQYSFHISCDNHTVYYELYYAPDISMLNEDVFWDNVHAGVVKKLSCHWDDAYRDITHGCDVINRYVRQSYKYGDDDYSGAGSGYYKYVIYVDYYSKETDYYLTSSYYFEYKRTEQPWNLTITYSDWDSSKGATTLLGWEPVEGAKKYQIEFYEYDYSTGSFVKGKYYDKILETTETSFDISSYVDRHYRSIYFKVRAYSGDAEGEGGWSYWSTSAPRYPNSTEAYVDNVHFGSPDNDQDSNKIYWRNNLNDSYKGTGYWYTAEVHTITENGSDVIVDEYEYPHKLEKLTGDDSDVKDDVAFDVSKYENLIDISNPVYVIITAYSVVPSEHPNNKIAYMLVKPTKSRQFYFWGNSRVNVTRVNGTLNATIRKEVTLNIDHLEGSIPNSYSYQWQENVDGKWVNIEGTNKAVYTPTEEQVNNDVQLRVRVINKAFAGEIFSNQISAKPDAENKIKGHVELKGELIDVNHPRPSGSESSLSAIFVCDDERVKNNKDLSYSYQWYIDGEAQNDTYGKLQTHVATIDYRHKKLKCAVTVTVSGTSETAGLTGGTFYSDEIEILNPIMNAPGYYMGSVHDDIYGSDPVNCHSFYITGMSEGTEISVTKAGEVHKFSNSDFCYYKHGFGVRPYKVDGLEGDTLYEVAYRVPGSGIYDSNIGIFNVRTKPHEALGDEFGVIYFDKTDDAYLRQNVHAKKCKNCKSFFEIERHIDYDGNKKCDSCHANYAGEGLYIESIGTVPGERIEYSGKAIKPTPKVYIGNTILCEGKDYKVSYKNNTKACESNAVDKKGKSIAPSVTVNGIGNYKGTCTEYFTIDAYRIGTVDADDKKTGEGVLGPSEGVARDGVTVENIAVAYSGKDIKVTPTVKIDGTTLKLGTDYTICEAGLGAELYRYQAVSSVKEIGKYTFYVRGKGNYIGKVKFNVEVTDKKLISKLKTNKIPNQNYTGSPITIDDMAIVTGKPVKTIREELGDGKYNVTYTNTLDNGIVISGNNTDPGTVKATIEVTDDTSDYCTTGSITLTYKIVGNDIGKATVAKIPDQQYTASPIEPDMTVTYKKVDGDVVTLKKGEDYEVYYAAGTNVNVGICKCTISGIGAYTGSKVIAFKITPYDVNSGNKVTAYVGTPMYYSPKGTTNDGIEVESYLTGSEVKLTEGVDYTISYINNKAVNYKKTTIDWMNPKKKPAVKYTFKGNYKGTKTVEFEIKERSLRDRGRLEGAIIENVAVPYTGKTYKPKFNVVIDGVALKEGKDYQIKTVRGLTPELVLNSDTYSYNIYGIGNYCDDFGRTCKFTITQSLVINNIKLNKIPNQQYTGEPITIDDMAIVSGKTSKTIREELGDGKYKVSYSNTLADGTVLKDDNSKIGTVTATITVTHDGKYCSTGSKSITYKIVGNDIKNVYLPNKKIADKIYTGSEIVLTNDELNVAFKNKDNSVSALVLGTDYDIEYVEGTNINVGIAKIVLKGKGIYTGTKILTFKINPYDATTDTSKISINGGAAINVEYSIEGAKPTPAVKFGEKNLTLNKDYTISYANNKKVAGIDAVKTPTMTLRFKGNFKGNKIVKYSILGKSIGKVTSVSIPDVVYSAKPGAWKSKATIKDGKNTLKEGIDYRLEYIYEIHGGTDPELEEFDDDYAKPNRDVYVAIIGMGNYASSVGKSDDDYKTYKYHIGKADISKAKIGKLSSLEYSGTGQKLTFEYDAVNCTYVISDIKGKKCELKVTLSDGTILKAKKDYIVVENSYSNNENKGSASFVIKGIQDYCGTKTVKFSIVQRAFVWWKSLFS